MFEMSYLCSSGNLSNVLLNYKHLFCFLLCTLMNECCCCCTRMWDSCAARIRAVPALNTGRFELGFFFLYACHEP